MKSRQYVQMYICTSAEFVEVFLQMCHQTDAERVAGVEAFLLHKEVHRLGQTLVIAHPEALHCARLDIRNVMFCL